MRKVRQVITAIFIGILLAVGLGEIIVRVLWRHEVIKLDNLGVISYEFMRELSDPELTYELKPGIDLCHKNYHIVTNRNGFRDKEYAVSKAPGVVRILVLGDSIAFGFGIRENRDVFCNVLEDMLNVYAKKSLPEKRFDVIGIAAPGYNTYSEISILKKKGLKYAPDLVVFAYCLNDTRDAVYSYEYANGTHLGRPDTSLLKVPSWFRRLLRRSVLYSYLADRANRLRAYIAASKKSRNIKKDVSAAPRMIIAAPETIAAAPSESPKTATSGKLYCPAGSQWHEIYINSHKGRHMEAMDNIILKDLEDAARNNDFKVLFVIFPQFENEQTYYPQGDRYLFGEVHAALKNLFNKHGFSVLDLKETFHGNPFNEVALDDCHPSLKGHRMAAEAIFDYLKESSLTSN